jgi:hypothetical protein
MTDQPLFNTDPNKIMINGPYNTVRLEGSIDGISKVLYVFFDQHNDITQQTECKSIFSKDFNQYLADTFYQFNNGSKKYDFFYEMGPHRISTFVDRLKIAPNFREIYIFEVEKMFDYAFKYDPDKDKVSPSDVFKNVRLHFIDFRRYFQNLSFLTNDMIELVGNSISTSIIDKLIHLSEILLNYLDNLSILITNKDKVKRTRKYIGFTPFGEQQSQQDTVDTLTLLKYYFDKLKDKNSNPKVKNFINDWLNDVVKQIETIKKFINETVDILRSYHSQLTESNNTKIVSYDKFDDLHINHGLPYFIVRDMMNNVTDRVLFIDAHVFYIGIDIMDMYFMRRFLDKKYITNGITYTGGFHSSNYIKNLVQKFDFKITHFYFSDITNLKDLNTEIKKLKTMKEVFNVFYPPVVTQCTDLSGFPKDFA